MKKLAGLKLKNKFQFQTIQTQEGFDGKYWFLSVGIEQDILSVELTNESIGIDVGIKESHMFKWNDFQKYQ